MSVSSPFIIAAAQLSVTPGNVAANVLKHVQLLRLASAQGASLVIFPELSLTGMSQPCVESGITACVGAPLLSQAGDGVQIASVVLHRDGTRAAHTKRFLDPAEEGTFRRGDGGHLLRFGAEHGALAICADTSTASHAADAARGGATVYAAGSVISHRSYAAECERLAGYAHEHGMAVLLANHAGTTGGYDCKGGSCAWDERGRVVLRANEREGIALLRRGASGDGWEGEFVPLSRTS